MAQVIKIKRSTSTASPTTLENGEIAYSSNSDKLFIGRPGGTTGDIDAIGGKFFTDLLDHTAGTVTAGSALIVDSNSKLDVLNVDNLTFNGNSIVSTDLNGALQITPNGSGDLILDGQKWPQADGTTGQYLKTDGSGQLTWAAVPSGSFTLSDGIATDTFTTGETLTFTGGTGITTAVTNNEVTIATTITQYTDALARAALSASGDLAYNSSTGVFSVTTYKDADARAAISVTDAGGDGSLAYNSSTGVITYTGPSAAEVQAHITAGTGVSIASGVVSIGQEVETTSGVTFATVETTGNVIVGGNLTVNGTVTSVNSTTVELGDNILLLNSGETGSPTANAGLEVERGTVANVLFRWNETTDKWEVTQNGTNFYVLIDSNNFETEITTLDGGSF